MKMCSALARAGHELTLTTKAEPSRQESGVESDFTFYGVGAEFEIRKLPRPSWRGGGLAYLRHTHNYISRLERPPDLVYSRDYAAAVVASSFPIPLVFEAHGPPVAGRYSFFNRRLYPSPNLRRLVVISDALKNLFRQSRLLPPDLEIVVAHDAADPMPATMTAREMLPASLFTSGVTHAGYVGHLYAGRGIGVIAELAERMPDHYFHIVGGKRTDLESWRRREVASNLHFHGFVAPGRLPAFYDALDVLLAPYQSRVMVAGGKTDTSSWMSPMKLFEYMAAGKPIISSDLPVLREVLRHGENALLVLPGDTGGWKRALEKLASEPGVAKGLAETARRDFSDSHTWDARAVRVLEGL
jgi:glycosyltransferase involved in cell wall biosynthesis